MTRLWRQRQHSRPAARLAAFSAAAFLVIGVQTPFWPVWLAGHGLDAQQIAVVFAAAIWAKVIATPLIGALADRIGRRRAVMATLAGIACLAYAALWPVRGLWPLLALNLVAGVAQSALLPLGDAVTLAAVRERGLDYGRIRVWGSLSFVIASVGGGAALAIMPAPAGGAGQPGPGAGAGRVVDLGRRLPGDAVERGRARRDRRGDERGRLALDRDPAAFVRSALLASGRQRVGAASEPSALLRVRDAVLARTRHFGHNDRRPLGRGRHRRNRPVLVCCADRRAARPARAARARRRRRYRALEPDGPGARPCLRRCCCNRYMR